ncbi:MAG TPA: YlbF family regulator [Firmicutes bacterium]|nr:YlbF family regulator [Bacillota bacterium]
MLENSKYMEISERVVDEIISLPVCQKYKALQHEIKQDEALQQLIAKFEKAKLAYEDVQRYGYKFHPDYKQVSQQLSDIKSELFMNELIREFKICEREIQAILSNVANVLSGAIDLKSIKKPANSGCGSGGCSHKGL